MASDLIPLFRPKSVALIGASSNPQKYGYWTRDDYPPDNADWMKGAEYHAGSWWPEWSRWMDAHDQDERVPARDPAKGKLKPIENAPGSYVLAK